MMHPSLSIRDLPPGQQFLQDIAGTTLKEAQLSRKYGFVFEKAPDDISMCEVCVVKSKLGSYFLVVCRDELLEWQVAIRTSLSIEPLESYAPRMLAEFIEATGFDVKDIEHIWPFTQ